MINGKKNEFEKKMNEFNISFIKNGEIARYRVILSRRYYNLVSEKIVSDGQLNRRDIM